MRCCTTPGRRASAPAASIAERSDRSPPTRSPPLATAARHPPPATTRHSDQQRDRLEDRVVRSPRAVQRRGLPGRLEEHADRIFDPGVTGNLSFTTNGGEYRVRGVETTLVARVTHGLTVHGRRFVEPQRADASCAVCWTIIRKLDQLQRATDSSGHAAFQSRSAPLGSPLASSPPFQGNIRARYEFPLGDYNAFVQ